MHILKKTISGVLFGLMLQLAVGPTCMYLLNVSITNGFQKAFSGVIAVVMVDALYIILAILGISKFLDKSKINLFKIFGGIVLILFALIMILSCFDITILPKIQGSSTLNKNNVFLFAAVLTLSNPLTIIFWSGVFTSKMLEDNYTKSDLILFSSGCLFSTLAFLSFISGAGAVIQRFFTENSIEILNLIIGLIIFGFGIKLIFSKIEVRENKK